MNPISDIYTSVMERVMPVLQEYWQFSLVGLGMLFVLGAVFNWKWTWDPNGHKTFGFNAWVYRTFGEKGARIQTGMLGGGIIAFAVFLWILM